jgi:hypothetical protein
MALSFAQTKGKAASNKVDSYEYKDGENIVRMFGGVLARYVYWLKGTNNKDVPVECLAFDRDLEKFANTEVDWVTTFYPDKKCSWAYTINCIDIKNQKVLALNLKKKMFEQIMSLASDLGADPTDPDTGFDIVFKRAKTGPLPFNVEYTLSQIKSKVRPLTEDERAMITDVKSIDEKFPRPTPAEVKAFLEKLSAGSTDDDSGTEDGVPEEAKDL